MNLGEQRGERADVEETNFDPHGYDPDAVVTLTISVRALRAAYLLAEAGADDEEAAGEFVDAVSASVPGLFD